MWFYVASNYDSWSYFALLYETKKTYVSSEKVWIKPSPRLSPCHSHTVRKSLDCLVRIGLIMIGLKPYMPFTYCHKPTRLFQKACFFDNDEFESLKLNYFKLREKKTWFIFIWEHEWIYAKRLLQ